MSWSFTGYIAGLGTSSGVRIVVGDWHESPLGAFSDVMIESAGGHRVLLAPSREVADFVATTYTFDEIVRGPVRIARRGTAWTVEAPRLTLEFTVGRRQPLGRALRLVPERVRDDERWARLLDPLARRLQPGVRTHGSAGTGRTEWYAARDLHAITAASGRFDGRELGTLAPLTPPVRFGFGSAPRRPSLTAVRSFVRESSDH